MDKVTKKQKKQNKNRKNKTITRPNSKSKKKTITKEKIKSKLSQKAKPTYKFVYVNENNKRIKDKKILERIKNMRIPPAYENVRISSNSKSNLQATGYDKMGRKQYIYNPDFVEKNKIKKYNDISKLGKYIHNIENDINNGINKIYKKPFDKWVQPESNITIVLYLLTKCNFRVGNLKYAKKYGSYGSTTLMNNHIKQNGNNMVIEFTGKKGVINKKEIDEPKIIKILQTLKTNKPGYLFTYINGTGEHLITSEHINDYLAKYDNSIVPKMFRTWYGNSYFIDKIVGDYKKKNNNIMDIINFQKKQTPKQTQTQRRKYIQECCQHVANKLHNTPAITRKSYIDDRLINNFIKNPSQTLHKFIKKSR